MLTLIIGLTYVLSVRNGGQLDEAFLLIAMIIDMILFAVLLATLTSL